MEQRASVVTSSSISWMCERRETAFTDYIYTCSPGGFLQWWYPTTIGFPTKKDHFGVFWGYHHLRKHPPRHRLKITTKKTHTLEYSARKKWNGRKKNEEKGFKSPVEGPHFSQAQWLHCWTLDFPCWPSQVTNTVGRSNHLNSPWIPRKSLGSSNAAVSSWWGSLPPSKCSPVVCAPIEPFDVMAKSPPPRHPPHWRHLARAGIVLPLQSWSPRVLHCFFVADSDLLPFFSIMLPPKKNPCDFPQLSSVSSLRKMSQKAKCWDVCRCISSR